MRVGILTLPPAFNYGGILQVYALQTVLKSIGVDSVVLDRRFSKKKDLKQYLIDLKRMIWPHLPFFHKRYSYDSRKKEFYSSRYKPFVEFINSRLYITPPIYDSVLLKEQIKDNSIGCVIVGSDQVWRPQCSPCLPDYFLSFAKENYKLRKISYAASFGTDKCEYNEDEIERYRELLQLFDNVSVREDSAVNMCLEYFGVNAIQVLDPTLLLPSNHYKELCHKSGNCSYLKGHRILSYMLDKTDEKRLVVSKVKQKLGTDDVYEVPIDKEVNISIERWLHLFYTADYVVTDSFHGCVFSILFNKSFIAIGNGKRGFTRFSSLLKVFELQGRLILDNMPLVDVDKVFTDINWDRVNSILVKQRKESLDYLLYSLYDKCAIQED